MVKHFFLLNEFKNIRYYFFLIKSLGQPARKHSSETQFKPVRPKDVEKILNMKKKRFLMKIINNIVILFPEFVMVCSTLVFTKPVQAWMLPNIKRTKKMKRRNK